MPRRADMRDYADLLMALMPGGIEASEAMGQSELCRDETLPSECDPRNGFQTLGIKVLGAVDGDPLFVRCLLPAGWRKVATGHSMWSDLRDHKDRKRASIFYKAAFYDRRAFMSLRRFFRVDRCYYADDGSLFYDISTGNRPSGADPKEKAATVGCHVVDANDVVRFRSAAIPDDHSYSDTDPLFEECLGWIDKNYPNWKDLSAYWDEEAE